MIGRLLREGRLWAVAAMVIVAALLPTTTVAASTFTYDAPADTRVDTCAFADPEVGLSQLSDAQEQSASPSVEVHGASTTPLSRSVATNTAPRAIGPAGNPGAFPGLSTSTSKLQHTFKHADDFGVTGNWNNANGQALQNALESHIAAPGTSRFPGTYRGDPVIHNLDPSTGLNVIQSPSGQLVSGWRLSADQLRHVLENGKLGGG